MRAFNRSTFKALPNIRTVAWDGLTYYSGLPSASIGEYIPVHGLGTFYPIAMSLTDIVKWCSRTQIAKIGFDVGGTAIYDDGTYTRTYSCSGKGYFPISKTGNCYVNEPSNKPVVYIAYTPQGREHLNQALGVANAASFGMDFDNSSALSYSTLPTVEVEYIGSFTDVDNIEAEVIAATEPITMDVTSTDPMFTDYTSFIYPQVSCGFVGFSIGDDGLFYINLSAGVSFFPTFGAHTTKNPTRETIVGSLLIGSDNVTLYGAPRNDTEWSETFSFNMSIEDVTTLEHDPDDGGGAVWNRSSGTKIRQNYI